MIFVRSLLGLGRIPSDRTSASKWLARHNIPTFRLPVNGGEAEAVELAQLPSDVRLAYLRREIEELYLDPGTYDDAAHDDFWQASPSRRERAERKAAVARLLVALGLRVPWTERLALVHERFGVEGHSKPRLKAILRAVRGVDPINFAPALLDKYQGAERSAEISRDAWRFFLTTIRDAGPDFPLKQAWRDTRDVAAKTGWAWPSPSTVYRRWQELPEAQRLAARIGRAEAVKRLAIPATRDKTTIGPLEWVSLDGRTKDFWTDFGDGRAMRATFLALVDVASNYVLDWELATSENAAATVRLIKRTCGKYGTFDRLYTDNGAAFAGHLVAGGNVFRFRNGGKKPEGVQPPGICQIMGIQLHFATPGNGQAKIAERTFATLSRVIDDRPEFKGAHAGHKPGASPGADVKPIPLETALRVIEREVRRHNSEQGRRSHGARGRSYEQAFREGLADRVTRRPTARQLYLAGLIYTPVAVDRFGQVRRNGWAYGGPSTQEKLLPYHGTGKRILLGRDPDDFSTPALAFDENGHLICEGIEPVKAGAYGSVDGIRDAARNRKAAREAVAAGEAENDRMKRKDFERALAALDGPDPEPFEGAKDVVKGQFNSPIKATLKPPKPKRQAKPKSVLTEELMAELDRVNGIERSRYGR